MRKTNNFEGIHDKKMLKVNSQVNTRSFGTRIMEEAKKDAMLCRREGKPSS